MAARWRESSPPRAATVVPSGYHEHHQQPGKEASLFMTDREPPENPDWDLPPEPEQIPEPVNGAQPAPEDPPQDDLDQTPKPYNGDAPAADAEEA